jgi:hypothetical protein
MNEEWEVVDKSEFAIPRGRVKYAEKYSRWFAKVLTLRDNEMLKIKIGKKLKMPSPPAVRFAVDRWNVENPDKKIDQMLKNSRTDEPIIYLYRLNQEEEKCRNPKRSKSV